VRDEIYKYILDDEDTSFKSYYRRWKDTALIEKQKVFVYRIRWTKSAYDEKKEEDPFFHVPIDQLREYPGFVYHCHILAH
jgi:FtsP/CotA-like multicopper oxidase with cupredoxin domain